MARLRWRKSICGFAAGIVFFENFSKKIKKQSTTKVYISPYITRAGASVLDKTFDKWLAAYER